MTEQQAANLLESIRDILLWFDKHHSECSLPDLMDKRDKLAALSYGLATLVGNQHIDYNHLYFLRRIHVVKKMNSLAKEGLAMNKAENQALEANHEVFEAEKEKEGEAFKTNLLLKQVNKNIDAMSQRISYLKQELSNT